MSGHYTPAPWWIGMADERGHFAISNEGGSGYVVAVTCGGLPDGIEQANACVLSAAPELYEAAKSAAREMGELNGESDAFYSAMGALISAISKAEGRT